MFSDRRSVATPRWALVAVALVLAILALLGMPRIVQTQPAADTEFVPSTASIRITFNRAMDRVSVESRFTIDPPHGGHFVWDESGKNLSFVPDDPWPAGAQITYGIRAGSRSNFFLPVLRTKQWSFSVGVPRLAYLWPFSGKAELYARSLDSGETVQLTETPHGVLDFDVIFEGAQIVYTALAEEGGSEIWLLDLVSREDSMIHRCSLGFRCQEPRLSPDFTEVAFERSSVQGGSPGGTLSSSSEVWKVRVGTDSQAFRLSSPDHEAYSPRWTPTGDLTYYDATEQEIILVDPVVLPEPAIRGTIANDLGEVGAWAADGVSLIFPDMVILDETYSPNESTGDEFPLFYSHLFIQSFDFGLREDLSRVGYDLVEDASPVVSPNGLWIAFSRKFLDEDLWTPGRQVWVMRSDGSEAKQLTDSPDFNHSALEWNPGGTALTYVRINQSDFAAGPEVWIYEMESGEQSLLSNGGYLPQWIP
jgi:Tol biopolymer transport system component